MPESLEGLRALIEANRPRCKRDGYPPEVRVRVLAYSRSRRAAGQSLAEVAAALGVSRNTLASWTARPLASDRTLVPVVITPPSHRSEPASAGLSVVSPRGYRVEGLDLAGAAALLERLG